MSLTGVVSVEDAVLPPQAWSFRTTTSQETSTPQTLFGALTPQTTMVSDPAPVELGTAFSPTRDGTVSHVRFFKGGTDNGGAHTGSVWSLAGERLATVEFTNETPSGWQSARLATPLPVSAGTTYVVSYFAPQGHYSATNGFFTSPHTAGDLTAPASNNGRYLYGPTGGFPSQSYGGANYFVDVAFSTGEVALGIADRTPAANATQVPRSSAVSVTFTEPLTTGAILALTTATGSVTGDVARSVDERTLTFTPSAPLPADTIVTVGLTGVFSVDGDSMAPESWTFRTQALPPMTIISRSPVAGATDVPRTSPVSVTFSEQLAPGAALTVSGPGGAGGWHNDLVSRRTHPHLHAVGTDARGRDHHRRPGRGGQCRRRVPGAGVLDVPHAAGAAHDDRLTISRRRRHRCLADVSRDRHLLRTAGSRCHAVGERSDRNDRRHDEARRPTDAP